MAAWPRWLVNRGREATRGARANGPFMIGCGRPSLRFKLTRPLVCGRAFFQPASAATRDVTSTYRSDGSGPLATAATFSARCASLQVPTIVVSQCGIRTNSFRRESKNDLPPRAEERCRQRWTRATPSMGKSATISRSCRQAVTVIRRRGARCSARGLVVRVGDPEAVSGDRHRP